MVREIKTTADPRRERERRRIVLEGDIPNPAYPPSGCTFHPRCFKATEICTHQAPEFAPFAGLPTRSACHHAGPFDATTLAASQAARRRPEVAS